LSTRALITVHARTVVPTLHGFAVAQGIESKPEPIIPKKLPIILSRICQIIQLTLFPFFIKTKFTKKKQKKKTRQKGHCDHFSHTIVKSDS